jgi:hypothetical protein
MSVGYRDEGDTQLAGSNRGPAGVADATATKAASSITALRAE